MKRYFSNCVCNNIQRVASSNSCQSILPTKSIIAVLANYYSELELELEVALNTAMAAPAAAAFISS
jgi:hypothetical protein